MSGWLCKTLAADDLDRCNPGKTRFLSLPARGTLMRFKSVEPESGLDRFWAIRTFSWFCLFVACLWSFSWSSMFMRTWLDMVEERGW